MTKTSKIVPPGISESDFEKALNAIRKVVGEQAVINDVRPCPIPGSIFSLVNDDRLTPSAAVLPGSTEDVQAIMLKSPKNSAFPSHRSLTSWNMPMHRILVYIAFGLA